MLLAVYQHLAEGFFVAFGEGWGAVGVDGAEVVLEGIEQPGYEEPGVTRDRYRCHQVPLSPDVYSILWLVLICKG